MTGWMKMLDDFIEYLDELIPNPACELNYHKDYELLIAVMLSAQTTDKRVNEVTAVLFQKYPTLEALQDADLSDLMRIIRPIGTFQKKSANVKAIAYRLLEDQGGKVPKDRAYLETLPGVGRKTTNVVLGELFHEQCIAVDTHVERVSKRLKLTKEQDDVLTVEKKLTKKLKGYDLWKMHHQILLFGRYYCKSQNPQCEHCKMQAYCRYYKNQQKKKVTS